MSSWLDRSAISFSAAPKGSISRFSSFLRLPGRIRRFDRLAAIERRPLAGRRAQHVEPLDQRMPDIGAGRPAELAVHLRLKGQDGEDLVDEGRHAARAARTPDPDARRDVLDDRDRRPRLPHAPCDAEIESGAVDDDEHVRVRLDDRLGRLALSRDDARGIGDDLGDAVERHLLHGKDRLEAEARHAAAADAEEAHPPPQALAERLHEAGAERIAQFLAGDDERGEVRRLEGLRVHDVVSPGQPDPDNEEAGLIGRAHHLLLCR